MFIEMVTLIIVTWNGRNFSKEINGSEVHKYIESWALFMEAD